MKEKKKITIEHWMLIALLMVGFDIVAIVGSYFLALLLRFDFSYSRIPESYLQDYFHSIWIYLVVCILLFFLFHLYAAIWQFASYRELRNMIIATAIAIAYYVISNLIFGHPMPASYYIFGGILQFFFTLGVRFAHRFVLLLRGRNKTDGDSAKVMIIGAGAAGQVIQRDMKMSPHLHERVVVFIDDDQNKWGRFIDGVLVAGGRESILENIYKYQVEKIYLAMPAATPEQRRDILDICKETKCVLKTLPGIAEIINGEVNISQLQDVSVDDLLGREPIKADLKEVFAMLNGKVVLVTGGGGSIGSELCRQIAAHDPKKLILLDVYENSAFELQNELKETYPDLNLVTLIGSVRDSRRMFDIFQTYKPQIVYHAAAHKHVPLMEDSPAEAIKNNSIGTYKTAYAAMVNGCERFVLISTDKAVNPVNVMGCMLYNRDNYSEHAPVLFFRERRCCA